MYLHSVWISLTFVMFIRPLPMCHPDVNFKLNHTSSMLVVFHVLSPCHSTLLGAQNVSLEYYSLSIYCSFRQFLYMQLIEWALRLGIIPRIVESSLLVEGWAVLFVCYQASRSDTPHIPDYDQLSILVFKSYFCHCAKASFLLYGLTRKIWMVVWTLTPSPVLHQMLCFLESGE